MRVEWYDFYASIPYSWDPSHILWNVSSPRYVSAVRCPISYHYDISCRPSDAVYHIIMTFRVLLCTRRQKVSCQQGIENLFEISCLPFRYLFVGVASYLLNLVMEQRYTILFLFVLLLMNGQSSKASRHRVNE